MFLNNLDEADLAVCVLRMYPSITREFHVLSHLCPRIISHALIARRLSIRLDSRGDMPLLTAEAYPEEFVFDRSVLSCKLALAGESMAIFILQFVVLMLSIPRIHSITTQHCVS